jgi:hypothetical protein
MTTRGLSYKVFNLPSHPDHKYIWFRGGDLNHPGVIPQPLPEVNFLMVEIPSPKPYIFMIRVTRQIKCLIAQAPGGHTLPPNWSDLFKYRFLSGVGLSPRVKKCWMHNFTLASPPIPNIKFLSFVVSEKPSPKPYIFMIRVTRQIKCLIAQAPGGHTLPPNWSDLFNGWDPHL